MQESSKYLESQHIAMYLPAMDPGGVELVFAMLSGAFARRGHRVTFLLGSTTGPNLAYIPKEVAIVDLKAPRGRTAVFALAAFLRKERPDVLLSALDPPNVVAIAAAKLARVNTRVVVSIRYVLSNRIARAKTWQDRSLRWVAPWAYRNAAAIIAVSDGVADDLAAVTGIPRERMTRIYNPAMPDILERARQPLDCPEFEPGAPPVILGVGRLVEDKDFATLVKAFAELRKTVDAQLVILGEGSLRDDLTSLCQELGVSDRVSLPGFINNPYPYFQRAAVFVLSSACEAFGVVIIEALACGTPVVSTDCPGGPAEILGDGKYGMLVPVGRPDIMATAIERTLATASAPELRQARAAEFDLEAVASAYLSVLLG